MKHVNTRFPDDPYDEMAEAANAEERPIGSWLRIAAKEKLARRESGKVRYESSGGVKGLELQGHRLRRPARSIGSPTATPSRERLSLANCQQWAVAK